MKTIARRWDEPTEQFVTEKITYYISSTLLGGQVVTELSEQGAKERTSVFADGGAIASQTVSSGNQSVQWQHYDPSGASYRGTDSTGQWNAAKELDPLGANAGFMKPITWNVPDKKGLPVPYPEIADMLTNPGGGCTLDFMPIPCEIRDNLGASGSLGAVEVELDGRRTQRDVRAFGLGLYGVWMPGGTRVNTHSSNEPNDTTWQTDDEGNWIKMEFETTRTETSGHWQFVPISFRPQEPAKPSHDPSKPPQKPAGRLPFNNCEEFVDFLVKLAANYASETTGVLTVRNHSEVAKALGGNMMAAAYFGYESHINNDFDNFKDELVKPGKQGSGVYGHVLGMGGSYLAGAAGMFIGAHSALFDRFQKMKGDPQGPAEVAGNTAGLAVGKRMWAFISGSARDQKGLTSELKSILCK